MPNIMNLVIKRWFTRGSGGTDIMQKIILENNTDRQVFKKTDDVKIYMKANAGGIFPSSHNKNFNQGMLAPEEHIKFSESDIVFNIQL